MQKVRGRRGLNRVVISFTNTRVISAYRHYSCDFGHRSLRGVLDTTLCDEICR